MPKRNGPNSQNKSIGSVGSIILDILEVQLDVDMEIVRVFHMLISAAGLTGYGTRSIMRPSG